MTVTGGNRYCAGKRYPTRHRNIPMTVTGGNRYSTGMNPTRHEYSPMTVTEEDRYWPGNESLCVTSIAQ